MPRELRRPAATARINRASADVLRMDEPKIDHRPREIAMLEIVRNRSSEITRANVHATKRLFLSLSLSLYLSEFSLRSASVVSAAPGGCKIRNDA